MNFQIAGNWGDILVGFVLGVLADRLRGWLTSACSNKRDDGPPDDSNE